MRRRTIRGRRSRRALWTTSAAVVVVAAGVAGAVYLLSGVTLSGDPSALARIHTQLFAGSIDSVNAVGPDGKTIPLAVRGGRITPTEQLTAGKTISLNVVVRRPGWSSWALGAERHEHLTVRTPVAHLLNRWLTGATPRLRYDTQVSTVLVGRKALSTDAATVALPVHASAGQVVVAAAARAWELPGSPEQVTWFPPASHPVVLALPKPGAQVNPLTTLRLTFARPLTALLGSNTPSGWKRADSHTLVYRPTGYGARFTSAESVRLPITIQAVGAAKPSRTLTWPVAPASFLRLQQLLAQEGYLPLTWSPATADVAHTPNAEFAAAVNAPEGSFHWRYANTPHELVSLWQEGQPNEITRGAVMMFQHDHNLAVDAIAGPQVWRAVIADAIAGKRRDGGYSYVYVHRNVPQLLTLWHNGRIVLTSPGNTGVPAAPTALGTWPVFEHIPVGRMSGQNPDGSHYDDPGIQWISYFHGGEALHAFNRASFGTPQSLGCVELPLAQAAKVWPYTPIGTLVTIEN